MNRALARTLWIVVFAVTGITEADVSTAAAPGHERYIVVMKAAKPGTPDVGDDEVQKLGGKVEFRIPGRLVVSLPAPAVEALRKHARVKYLQRSVTGAVTDDGSSAAASIMRLHSEANSREVSATATPPVWRSGTYKYDGAGNIYAIGADPADADRHLYTYDELSRLTREATMNSAGQPLAVQESFEYDPYGNITRHTVGGTPTTYPVVASTNRFQTGTGLPYQYNEIGALTKDANMEYDYDAFGMLRSRAIPGDIYQNDDFYIYTASDERIGVRQGGDTWTWSLRDFGGKVLRQYQSSQTFSSMDWLWMEDYVYRGGALVSGDRVREEGGRREFHLDHLGSPRLVTGPDGYSTSTREFAPFGIQRGDWTQETEGGFDREEPMRFTGHERDFRNGYLLTTTPYVDYMHARFYSSTVGRFLSVDPVINVKRAMVRPQAWNRYAYVENDPTNLTDPDGRCLLGVLVCVVGYLYEHITGNELIHTDYNWRAYTQREFVSGPGYGLEEDYATEMTIMAPFTGFVMRAGATRSVGNAVSTYEDITLGRSVTNRATNVTAQEAEGNLEANGFAKSVSKDGNVSIYQKGSMKYTIRATSKSTGGATMEVFKNGQLIQKIRLGVNGGYAFIEGELVRVQPTK